MTQYEGLVIREQSGFYDVEIEDERIIRCRLRGKLKEEAQLSDICAVGDRVTITINVEESGIDTLSGVIETVRERHTTISRAVRTTGKRGAGQAEREQIIIANPDQALFVFSAASPTPNWSMLDRLLVTAERAAIEDVGIIFNKADLLLGSDFEGHIMPYRTMGYDILFTSAEQNLGLDDLRARLRDKITVLTGPSGVGKTSLLNRMQPGLGRVTKSISAFSQEGVHTTRDSALIKLDGGGYLADTPGVRYLNVWDVEPDELDGYFLDIAEYAPDCRFRNCTHTNEAGCAVRKAVQKGAVSRRRYENFLQLREELRDTYIVY